METGYYYLQSRYYDPNVGRFISADDVEYLGADGTPLSYNLFAYCCNDPINYVDPSGRFFGALLFGAAIGFAAGFAISAISQYSSDGEVDWRSAFIDATFCAISGAFASTNISLGVSIALNAFLGGATYITKQFVKDEKIEVGAFAINVLGGAVSGMIGGRGADSNGMRNVWKAAGERITREARRINCQYAAKQIVISEAKRELIKSEIAISTCRFIAGVFAANRIVD